MSVESHGNHKQNLIWLFGLLFSWCRRGQGHPENQAAAMCGHTGGGVEFQEGWGCSLPQQVRLVVNRRCSCNCNLVLSVKLQGIALNNLDETLRVLKLVALGVCPGCSSISTCCSELCPYGKNEESLSFWNAVALVAFSCCTYGGILQALPCRGCSLVMLSVTSFSSCKKE